MKTSAKTHVSKRNDELSFTSSEEYCPTTKLYATRTAGVKSNQKRPREGDKNYDEYLDEVSPQPAKKKAKKMDNPVNLEAPTDVLKELQAEYGENVPTRS